MQGKGMNSNEGNLKEEVRAGKGIWGKGVPGRGNNTCKGPGTGVSLPY